MSFFRNEAILANIVDTPSGSRAVSAGGHGVAYLRQGDHSITLRNDAGTTQVCVVKNVNIIPDAKRNLLSASQLLKAGVSMTISPGGITLGAKATSAAPRLAPSFAGSSGNGYQGPTHHSVPFNGKETSKISQPPEDKRSDMHSMTREASRDDEHMHDSKHNNNNDNNGSVVADKDGVNVVPEVRDQMDLHVESANSSALQPQMLQARAPYNESSGSLSRSKDDRPEGPLRAILPLADHCLCASAAGNFTMISRSLADLAEICSSVLKGRDEDFNPPAQRLLEWIVHCNKKKKKGCLPCWEEAF